MTVNQTSSDDYNSVFQRHVTLVTTTLPVLLAGSRDDPSATSAPAADENHNHQNTSAIIIIVLSVVVLAAIFFTVCGLLVKSQALVRKGSYADHSSIPPQTQRLRRAMTVCCFKSQALVKAGTSGTRIRSRFQSTLSSSIEL